MNLLLILINSLATSNSLFAISMLTCKKTESVVHKINSCIFREPRLVRFRNATHVRFSSLAKMRQRATDFRRVAKISH
jgi:hypothetical protein